MVIHVDLGVVEVVRPIQVANEEQPTSMSEVGLFGATQRRSPGRGF
jgi:hypothetical protein